MYFYAILYLTVVFTSMSFPKDKLLGKMWMLLLCFFSMFRGVKVGTDTENYLMRVSGSDETSIENVTNFIGKHLEFTYNTVIMLIDEYNLHPRFIIVFLSGLSFLFLYLMLKRTQSWYPIGTMLFLIMYYAESLNIARQICASIILLYAFTYLFDQRPKPQYYLSLVLFATTIHLSSLLYFLLFLFWKVKTIYINRDLLFYILSLILLLNVVSPINIADLMFSFFDGNIYMETYDQSNELQVRSVFGIIYDVIRSFLCLGILNTCLVNEEKKSVLTQKDFLFYISILISIVFSSAEEVFARIIIPLMMYQIYYISDAIKYGRMHHRNIYFISYVFFLVFFELFNISKGSMELIPYSFCID